MLGKMIDLLMALTMVGVVMSAASDDTTSLHASDVTEDGDDVKRTPRFEMPYYSSRECLRQARKGSCRVIACYQEKFKFCPSTLHAEVTNEFCDAAPRGMMGTRKGLAWIHKTNRCVMLSFALRSKMIRCANVDEEITTLYRDCARDSGICDVLRTEADQIHRSFRNTWMTLLEAGLECPGEVLDNFLKRSLDSDAS